MSELFVWSDLSWERGETEVPPDLKYKLKYSTSPRDVDSSNIQNDQEKNVASTSHGAGSAAKKRRLISSSSQMEIFAKNIQMEKLKTVRDGFFCRRCEKFPRDVVFGCADCGQIFCHECCDDKCTRAVCSSRIIEDPRLTILLSSFGTHPCNYLKNGCHEEIIANMDTLNAHDLSCIFQKVPCPKLDCHEKKYDCMYEGYKVIKIDGLGTHQSLLAEHGSIWTDKWVPAVFNVNEHWMDNKKNIHIKHF